MFPVCDHPGKKSNTKEAWERPEKQRDRHREHPGGAGEEVSAGGGGEVVSAGGGGVGEEATSRK